jgi:type II secretory pathway component PulJ
MNDYIKMLQQANIKIAELEKECDELKVTVSYLDAKITSASNCHERATPFLLDEALNRTHLDFHREALKEGK